MRRKGGQERAEGVGREDWQAWAGSIGKRGHFGLTGVDISILAKKKNHKTHLSLVSAQAPCGPEEETPNAYLINYKYLRHLEF